MISPSDKDYQETKLIKQGRMKMNEDFVELAKWISNTYDVSVMNLYYDFVDKNTPRLSVIFEYHRHELKCRDGIVGNFHEEKQLAIAEKFQELLNKKSFLNRWFNLRRYKADRLLVIFTSFEPVAISEACMHMSPPLVEELQTELNNLHIWRITPFPFTPSVVYFLYTNEQAEMYKNNPVIHIWEDRYYKILKQYDGFSYITRDKFSITIDSKQNLVENYENNLYYYFH